KKGQLMKQVLLLSYELEGKLNTVFEQFSNWFSVNKLIVNQEKTVMLQFFGRKKIQTAINIRIDNVTLVPSETTKFLGIHIDSDISWRYHINNTCRKLSSGYYAILQPKKTLSYGVTLWGDATDSERVLIAQKRVIRLMFVLRRFESCKSLFKQHAILTAPCIYIYNCVIYIKKNIKKYITNAELHNYQTRHGYLIQTQKHRTALYEKSPLLAGIKFYNCLPP
ncbi:hypothetical protein NQ317_012427, partial [Molorchus minor]